VFVWILFIHAPDFGGAYTRACGPSSRVRSWGGRSDL
jgi:hypothetical protein